MNYIIKIKLLIKVSVGNKRGTKGEQKGNKSGTKGEQKGNKRGTRSSENKVPSFNKSFQKFHHITKNIQWFQSTERTSHLSDLIRGAYQ